MIKLLLKHKLAEIAINTFFSKLSSNFIVNTKLNVGQTFTNIITLQLHDRSDDSALYGEDLSFYEYTKYGRCEIESITSEEVGVYYYDIIESYTVELKTNKKEYGLNVTFNNYRDHVYIYKEDIIEVIP